MQKANEVYTIKKNTAKSLLLVVLAIIISITTSFLIYTFSPFSFTKQWELTAQIDLGYIPKGITVTIYKYSNNTLEWNRIETVFPNYPISILLYRTGDILRFSYISDYISEQSSNIITLPYTTTNPHSNEFGGILCFNIAFSDIFQPINVKLGFYNLLNKHIEVYYKNDEYPIEVHTTDRFNLLYSTRTVINYWYGQPIKVIIRELNWSLSTYITLYSMFIRFTNGTIIYQPISIEQFIGNYMIGVP